MLQNLLSHGFQENEGARAPPCHVECHSSHQWILSFFRVKVKEGASQKDGNRFHSVLQNRFFRKLIIYNQHT